MLRRRGFIGHKSYTAQTAPRSNWMPEERQTRFHEEYVKNLQNDSLFWGTWINNMFDYGSARRPYGINGEGLVTIDRRERKDAYYLYRALWNERKPTLHIVDKRRSLRDRNRAGVQRLFVGRSAYAVRGRRHRGNDPIRRLPVPFRLGGNTGYRAGESSGRGAVRQRNAQSRQRAKTEAAAGPSANSRSATDKLGWKGMRSEKTCT